MNTLCATLSTALALLIVSTNASPLPSHALSIRQAGWYDIRDTDDPAHAGTVHCFRGGRWLSQDLVKGVIDQACTTTASHSYDTAHFSFVPSPDGTFPLQKVDHEYRNCYSYYNPPACDPATDTITFTGDLKDKARANSETCTYAMTRIVDVCHGDNQDTRGGWFEFDGDGSTYGADLHEH